MSERQDKSDTGLKERVERKTQEPAQYHVVLLNDDYTTMAFVIEILETVFQQSPAAAYRIMMSVHQQGRGVAGTYPWEVAETKADTVAELATAAGFPLKAVVEPA